MVGTADIAIVASPRSGTNFFCDTLGDISGVINLFEVFNPRGAFGTDRVPGLLEHFSGILGSAIPSPENPDLVTFARENPLDFLAEVRRFGTERGYKAMTYKVFPDQLDAESLHTFLSEPNRSFIFIARNRIDCFISFKKAMKTDAWVNQKTSDIEIEVGLGEFLDWCKRLDAWYDTCRAQVQQSGQRKILLSYDVDINVPKNSLLEKQCLMFAALGVDVGFPENISAPTYLRQGEIMGPFKKIVNGEELKRQLIDRRLLGRYALRNALIGPSFSTI